MQKEAQEAPVASAEDARRALARAESARASVEIRLRETSVALFDASQSLAQIPLLQHQVAETREENVWFLGERNRLVEENERLLGEAEGLRGEINTLRAHVDALEGSWSWRLSAPVRRLGRAFRSQRA
jgi:hypothetical protein